MNKLQQRLLSLAQQCIESIAAIQPRGGIFSDPSEQTRADYLQLGRVLMQRVRNDAHDLQTVVTSTSSPRTFQKRMAALRYFLHARHYDLMVSLRQSQNEQQRALQGELELHLNALRAFAAVQETGLEGTREKRKSKRRALHGLPDNWRETLYERSKTGKYGAAIITAALSGCRPAELKNGVYISRTFDETLRSEVIRIEIAGAKLKARQGQPRRVICYSTSSDHPLVTAMNHLLDQQANPELHVQIASPVNFTVEIRRLGKLLWPSHRHAVTAYCLRHQWAADAKRTQDADSVSRGLGHACAKTRRNYGQAQQANRKTALSPIDISAARPIRSVTGQQCLPQPHA